jgi:uncharacterized membrane protein YidH (DUF202 family)
MSARKSGSGSISAVVMVVFLFCVFALIFNAGIRPSAMNSLPAWPQSLYTFVIYPLLYYLGGYVFFMLFFKRANSGMPGAIHVFMNIVAIALFIFILFSFFLFVQSNTVVGNVIRISLSGTLMKWMRTFLSMHVLLFIGGIFLYEMAA